MTSKTIVVMIAVVFTFQLYAGPDDYPGKHPDFEQIGNRKLEEKGIDFYSMEKEIALGKMMAQEVEKSAKMIEDPVISEYVNRIGQNLVRNSDAVIPFT